MKEGKKMIAEVLQASLMHVESLNPDASSLSVKQEAWLKCLIDQVANAKSKGVLTVLLTLAVKKIITPEQDIRNHQKQISGGFSGRTLDAKYITPFLRNNDFPYMKGGTGWLTRSLEQPSPYDQDYPGRITPHNVKDAFLGLVYDIEHQGGFAATVLDRAVAFLIALRDKNNDIVLPRPTNMSIRDIVVLLNTFWSQSPSGGSKVPVLAVYAAYECLISEVHRYRNHELMSLLSHTSADLKTGSKADINLKVDSEIVESVEIKHNVRLTPDLVEASLEKLKGTSVQRFYILSTDEHIPQFDDICKLTSRAKHQFKHEIIVNGVSSTLKYYLRLLAKPDLYLDKFVTALESDEEIGHVTKTLWKEVCSPVKALASQAASI